MGPGFPVFKLASVQKRIALNAPPKTESDDREAPNTLNELTWNRLRGDTVESKNQLKKYGTRFA